MNGTPVSSSAEYPQQAEWVQYLVTRHVSFLRQYLSYYLLFKTERGHHFNPIRASSCNGSSMSANTDTTPFVSSARNLVVVKAFMIHYVFPSERGRHYFFNSIRARLDSFRPRLTHTLNSLRPKCKEPSLESHSPVDS